jgi:hypothetical protein
MPFTLPNTEQSVTNPATQPWKTDSPPLDWLLNMLFPRDPQSAIQGIMGTGIGMPKATAKLSGMEQAAQASLKAMKSKQALDPLAQLIMDTFKTGDTLSRNAFIPTLKDAGKIIGSGGPGEWHSDIYSRLARSNPDLFTTITSRPAMDTEHAFQTVKGLDVPYDVASVLTGSFDKLKQVAELITKGIPMSDIMSMFQATGPVI